MAVTPDYPLLVLIAAGTLTATLIVVLRLISGVEGSLFSPGSFSSPLTGIEEE